MIASLLLFYLLRFTGAQALAYENPGGVGRPSSQRNLENSTVTTRIVGGWNAVPTRYEYFTLLQLFQNNNILRCGGSLIHPDIVLTAAHCLGNVQSIVAWVNYTRGDKMTGHEFRTEVEDWIAHPDYDSISGENDVGLIKLKRSIVGVVPVRINKIDAIPKVGQTTTVFGFGHTQSGQFPDRLKEVDVNVVSHNRCNAMNFYNGDISDRSMICAGVINGGKDACAGDSGGPLIIGGQTEKDDLQVGIVSWGKGCGEVHHPGKSTANGDSVSTLAFQPLYPGVYTRVSTYARWIDKTICKMSNTSPTNCLSQSIQHIMGSGGSGSTSKSWAMLSNLSKGMLPPASDCFVGAFLNTVDRETN